MALSLITAPVAEPLSIEDVKAHLRVDGTSDDAVIASLIVAARQYLDPPHGGLNRCLMTQTWDYVLDAIPSDGTIWLPLAPVVSITHLKYLDSSGVEQTYPGASYRTDLVSEPGRIATAYGVSWPSTYSVSHAVTVRLVCGYTNAAAVPATAKRAMLLLIGHWFSNREAVLTDTISKDIEYGVANLLFPLIVWPRGAT